MHPCPTGVHNQVKHKTRQGKMNSYGFDSLSVWDKAQATAS